MKLFNSLTNQFEKLYFTDNPIKIYLCGVTVYDDCHIGHARTIIVFDVLRRYFLSKKLKVTFIQNFTDIDDKIIHKAGIEGTSYDKISSKYIDSYFRDFDALNVIRSTIYPKATEHINDIIKFIEELKILNKAYVGVNGVYFRVNSFPQYGKLSNKKSELLDAGARIEIDETKDDPRDFALWKFYSSEPVWSSPWGAGRPGWHIECSAMAVKYLGLDFEIHGGGQDLVFPHHENEIAQTEGLYNKTFARTWLHVGLVTIKKEKMSKSVGNTIKISELLKKLNPNVIRLFCLSAHYSKPLDYSEEAINEIKIKWGQIENAYFESKFRVDNNQQYSCWPNFDYSGFKNECSKYYKEFENYVEDDLNFSNALTSFFKFIGKINSIFSSEVEDKEIFIFIYELLTKFMYIIGLRFDSVTAEEKIEIQEYINKRNDFRNSKNYKVADEIRQELLNKFNVDLIDHNGFTVWKKIK
jgi:cysteinyl-tRNA synthetase